MKTKKQRLNYFTISIVLVVIVAIVGISWYGISSLVSTIQEQLYTVEDESLFLSPPQSEEILYRKLNEGIFIITPSIDEEAQVAVKLTSGEDYAPSWNNAGNGFYFLRKTDTSLFNLMYFNYDEHILQPGFIQSFTELDIPNIDSSFVRISPDGKHVIVSSYDWGISVLNVESGKLIPDFPMDKVYQCLDIFSRNNKFFLFTQTNLYDKQFIYGVSKPDPSANLYFATSSLETFINVDKSMDFFNGYSFSSNGYTFSYSKDDTIYYVDSIANIKPLAVTKGCSPDIRPTMTLKKLNQYKWKPPFWSNFDFTNVANFLSLKEKNIIVVSTPHELATIDTSNESLTFYYDDKEKETSYLGWKLIDFLYEDVNLDNEPELLVSWWPGGDEVGAERISFFSILPNGILKEQYVSRYAHKNLISFKDLNGDGIKELLNIYLDASGGESSNLENLYWEDILIWNGKEWKISNHQFSDKYEKLKESYEVFLVEAIKKPDDYGKSLNLIKTLLDKVDSLLNYKEK
ncbi:MAG: hypothetical protein KAH01_04620 [Caldisericia bacterium]|nr:hypothetical protein [Caldisericia bacterium]